MGEILFTMEQLDEFQKHEVRKAIKRRATGKKHRDKVKMENTMKTIEQQYRDAVEEVREARKQATKLLQAWDNE